MPGLKQSLILGALASSFSAVFAPPLAWGIMAGLGAVLLAKFLHLRLLRRALEEKGARALAASGLGKHLLFSAAAVGAIAAGASPLGVVLGLSLYPLGLWLGLGAYVLRNR